MTTEQKDQVSAIKKELLKVRGQKQVAQEMLRAASIKADFPSPNEYIQYFCERKDRGKSILTAIAWDLEPIPEFDQFLEKVEKIDKKLAASVQSYGFCYEIEGYEIEDIYVNADEWENFHEGHRFHELSEIKKERVKKAISVYRSAIKARLLSELETNQITDKELIMHIDPSDLLSSVEYVKEYYDDYILTAQKNCLVWANEDQDIWDFIDKYRGRLLGASQIQYLPPGMKATVFAVK